MRSRRVFWFFFLGTLFLVFFRGQTALHLAGVVDDACYMRSLYRSFGFALPPCYADFYPPGIAFLWWPFALLGWFLGLLSGLDARLWVEPLIGLGSFFFYAASALVLDAAYRAAFPRNRPSRLWMAGFFLSIPALHYATSRTFLAHGGELFLASVLVYCLARGWAGRAAFFAAWLAATRPGDAPLLALPLGCALQNQKGKFPWRLAMACGVVAMPLAYIALFAGYGTSAGQEGSFLIPILQSISWKEIHRTFVGDLNGLLWSAPWWTALLILGAGYARHLTWTARAGWVGMMFLLCICIGWTGNGGGLFYRYLIGTYPIAGWIWLELEPRLSTRVRRGMNGLLGAQAFYLTTVSWLFGTRFGVAIWENPQATWISRAISAAQSVLLAAVTPLGLVLLSWWNPAWESIGGMRVPTYRLQGPALWLLTVVCAVLLVLALRHAARRQGRSADSVS